MLNNKQIGSDTLNQNQSERDCNLTFNPRNATFLWALAPYPRYFTLLVKDPISYSSFITTAIYNREDKNGNGI